ncbi:hypothetical protein BG004_004661 [Podila humilis]|nr:hypothetical protein BG004_004661 [Podila humilis]
MDNRRSPKGQKSPSVNNLISFWSDLDSPESATSRDILAGSQPTRIHSPHSILHRPGTSSAAANIASPSNAALHRHLRPFPQKTTASSPALLSSSPTSPISRGSAPLFPLRSVAPAQTRVFGTQRHALDTVNARPLLAAPAQLVPNSSRPAGPRAAHHQHPRPHPISTNRQGKFSSNPASPATNEIGTEGTRVPAAASESALATPRKKIEEFQISESDRNSPENHRRHQQQQQRQHQVRASVPLISAETPTSPSRQQGKGFLKLAVIPPVQTKEETLKKHHHMARSHPMVTTSEPLGRPIDALIPLVKPTESDSGPSQAAVGLDRISSAIFSSTDSASSNSGSGASAVRNSDSSISSKRNHGTGSTSTPLVDPTRVASPNSKARSSRPTSEPAIKHSNSSSPTSSANNNNQRRAVTSVEYGELTDAQVQGGREEKKRGQGSDIMYAVVKRVPAKPAIPKLVGASGSGTVIMPPSRPQSQVGSNHFQPIIGNNRRSLVKNNSEETVAGGHGHEWQGQRTSISSNATNSTSSTAVARSTHSKPGSRDSNVSDSTKRESFQSFTSFASTLDESIPEDSPGTFDERDGQEEMGLLQRYDGDKDSKPTKVITNKAEKGRIQVAGSGMPHSTEEKKPVPQRYGGGTPLGTRKSESSPENSTLDSTDTLFQPTAPLIAYPALDAYLSSLKPAKFSDIPKSPNGNLTTLGDLNPAASDIGSKNLASKTEKSGSKSKKSPPDPREGMFPPLHQVPIGVSLDELKINVTKPPGFFDQELQNVLLSSAMDGIMSGESSNIGISWMRIEIIRDFLQFVALYLSVSGNTFVNQRALYTSVNVIPALLSLDLPRAFGFGMIFLVLFCIVAFAALYTFKIMTRTDPNDDIEGLEVSSWSLRSKKQRLETISIVFLLTTLYLPLAKLSFDALVWSDTMWPVKNPYKAMDFPTLEPLGPSGIYRDPSDFCYVTSMKIQDLNFAWVILPLAIFTLCLNTVYFPLAIRRLVVLNLPRIDKYTEQGERRLDLDEEYKRLTNSDNCPYNFLYNGYRREYGTYKVVVMLTKLMAVVIVVLFSKDNCLFRSFERKTIESIRATLQILLTVGMIYRHYRTQPFLYASQNVSEYWSRACTVATSVIGLFIVLKVGPVSVTTLGIMLVATYVLMCVIVVWFVIRQTQKFQAMVKTIQQRLDFSLEIFNPKLNYFKHIKRRIWQETWTTTLLAEEAYKMPSGKVVAYSQSPHRPPYLLNFTGTVAERHVENLRIVRQIGLRSYSQACQFLTPAMVRKRTLILKQFVGPDMYYAPEFMASNIRTYFGKAYVVPFPFSVVFVYDESSVVVTLVKEHDLDRYIQQNQDPEIERRRELRYQLRALDGKFVVRPFIETRGVQRGRESNGTLEMSLVNAPVSYKRGLFTIHRKKMSSWQGHNMNPGFSVTITYSDGEVQDPQGSSQLLHETTIAHDIIGITRDFQVTPGLARLLRDNHALISRGVKKVKKVMQAYQNHYRHEAHRKDSTLSYDFFINVYDNPTLKKSELQPLLLATEENPRVRHPNQSISTAVEFLYERMEAVNRTRCHQWWYLFWDDLYRKNREEIPQLKAKEFSPAFPGSICYRPMARSDLEKFLEVQGCWQKKGRAGFMHVGVLNRMYTFLNELVFEKMTKDQRHRQLEMTTVERQRLENLFLVTKAKIHSDGSYKRIPLVQDDEDAKTDGNNENLGKKPFNGLQVGRKKSKKGWFDSITPGRKNKPQSGHGGLHVENFSPGYIIPQTWHQKASQFTAMLVGGRQDDIIGDSDEEDDLADDDSEYVAIKRRKTSMNSIETSVSDGRESYPLTNVIALKDRHRPYKSGDDTGSRKALTNEQKSPLLNSSLTTPTTPTTATTADLQRHDRGDSRFGKSGRLESWASMSTLQGDENNEAKGVINRELNGPEHRRVSQVRQGGGGAAGRDQRGSNLADDDPGMASDTMSVTSMSSEDYW